MKKLKKLQNNFTTIEQSKRLLELGIPANSADCYYDQYQIINFRAEIDYGYDFFGLNFRFIPCWSVGRLMEVCKICEQKKDYEQLCDELKYCEDYCVLIISHIIANLPIIDFLKWEG